MTTEQFLNELDQRIAKYDLLCHPFYKAWSAGELKPADLAEYGRDYYHHVAAFPFYLEQFGHRLTDEKTRLAVEANMLDELGRGSARIRPERSHADLWLDFVEGTGGTRELNDHRPIAEVKALIQHFTRVAREGTPEEALAAFYSFESQVPRIAREKARGLRENYGADDKTCEYFRIHTTADVHHSRIWRDLLERQITENPTAASAALDAAEKAAHMLWQVLDGIEERRRCTAS
jgi:pyrroloquinoline-quinone synthase